MAYDRTLLIPSQIYLPPFNPESTEFIKKMIKVLELLMCSGINVSSSNYNWVFYPLSAEYFLLWKNAYDFYAPRNIFYV